MAVSSINIQASSSHCFAHNDRSDKVTYLVDSSNQNECNQGHKEAQKLLSSFVKEAQKFRLENGLRALKSNTIKSVEAVVNLNVNHTIKDVEQLAKTIEKEFGFRAVQIAIHRDEGKDIKNKNYHAHIVMCNLTPEGKTIQRTLGRDGLKKLQDITALELKMTRGKTGSKTQRLEHREYKAKEQEKELVLEKEREKAAYSFRDFQQQITALNTENTDLKKELHKLNTAVNKGEADVKNLEERINTLRTTADTWKQLYEKQKEQPPKEVIVEKIVRVEDTAKIEKLEKELNQIKSDQQKVISQFSSFQTKEQLPLITQKEVELIPTSSNTNKIDSSPSGELKKSQIINEQIKEHQKTKPKKINSYEIEKKINKRWTFKDCVHWFWAQGEAHKQRKERFQKVRDIYLNPTKTWDQQNQKLEAELQKEVEQEKELVLKKEKAFKASQQNTKVEIVEKVEIEKTDYEKFNEENNQSEERGYSR